MMRTLSQQTVTHPESRESIDIVVKTDGTLFFLIVVGGMLSDGRDQESFCRVESALQRGAIEAGLFLSSN